MKAIKVNCSNTRRLTERWKKPKGGLYLKEVKAVLKSWVTVVATTQQKKVCQLRPLDQWEDKSSMAKRRPPIGLLKPADTPAATPLVVKARLWGLGGWGFVGLLGLLSCVVVGLSGCWVCGFVWFVGFVGLLVLLGCWVIGSVGSVG